MLDVPENELYSAYLDGELTAEEQAEMEELLNNSSAARQLLDELRALSATLQSLPVVELNEDLSGRVLRAAERQVLSQPAEAEQTRDATGRDTAPRPRFFRRMLRPRTLWWSGAAVAVALFLALGDFDKPNQQPAGDDRSVAIDTSVSNDSQARVPEIWADENFDPPTVAAADPPSVAAADSPSVAAADSPSVAAADSPPREQPVESPTSEKPASQQPADDHKMMIADSDKPSENPLATNQPSPLPSTTPDAAPDAAPKVAKPDDEVLIVKCDVSQKAADGKVLGEILAKRKIARLNGTDTETGKLFVEVDLTPTQLRALVSDLKSRREHFAAVSVPPIPGAARPRIPSAAREPQKITGTIRVGSAATGKVGATGNNKSLTGSPAAAGTAGAAKQRIQLQIGSKATLANSPKPTAQTATKPANVKRPSRQEQTFRVRFELTVVATPPPSKPADKATKTEN